MADALVFDALVLGLASGTSCIATCAPVVVPFLFSQERAELRSNAVRVALILVGRLVGYVAVGLALGGLGAFAASRVEPGFVRVLGRSAYGVAGALMLAAGAIPALHAFRPCRLVPPAWSPTATALLLGLATGLSLCPPFLAAAARVFGQRSSLQGAMYFALFFVGTSVYFLPLLGVSAVRRHQAEIRIVARLCCILVGLYYVVFLCILGG